MPTSLSSFLGTTYNGDRGTQGEIASQGTQGLQGGQGIQGVGGSFSSQGVRGLQGRYFFTISFLGIKY